MARKLYAIACTATKEIHGYSSGVISHGTGINTFASVVVADSEEDARAHGLLACHQTFPSEEGYQRHIISVYLVPDELIDMVSKPKE